MKKIRHLKVGQVLPIMVLCLIGFSAIAQKLPKVQQESIWAPANIKIDGKATEWDGKFQAYNPANYIYYTLSNDDKNLYFIVFVNEVLPKIIYGGITLTIINPKNKKNKIAVGFPLQNQHDNNPVAMTIHTNSNLLDIPTTSKGKIDSVMKLVNERSSTIFKEIQINGIDGHSDSTISIYNTLGIKTAFLFNLIDHKVGYTYELAIPLKYLSVSESHFEYDIILNGGVVLRDANGLYNGRVAPSMDYVHVPTDFKGEYTLAKK